MRFSDNHNFIRDLKVLPKGWRWTRLTELVDQSRGICYGIVQPGKHDPQGTPMINSQDIKNGIAIDKVKFYVSNHIHQKYRRSTIEGGELLLTLVGANFGQVGIATPNLIGHNCSRAVGIIPITESALFVSYCLRGPVCRHFMDIWANTTAQPTFNLKDVENLPIPQPPSCQRNAITHILETLDKRIELNQKNNKTLEEIAKALFKSWFIDFDPVRAKAERRSTGLPDEISDLFPDSFEDSVSTLIPTGWKKKNFGDFVIPKRGKIITKSTVTEGPIPVVAGGLNPSYFHNEHNVEGPVVTISGSGANAGFVNLYFDNIWASDCSYISKTEGKNTFTSYLFLKTFQKRVFAAQHGAAQPHVNPNDLMRLEFIFPNQDILDKFEYLVNPLFQKIHINNQAKKNLEIMRNILLPKLISGELRIPDAEKMIEEAGI